MGVIYNNKVLNYLYEHRRQVMILFALILLGTLIPFPVFAGPYEDVTQGLKDFADEALRDSITGQMTEAVTQIPKSFKNLFDPGSTSTSAVYNTAQSQFLPQVLQYIAAPLVSLVMLMQLYKISQRVESHQTLPAVKEVMILFFTLALMLFAVRHAWDICEFLFNLFAGLTNQISLNTTLSGNSGLQSIAYDWTDISFGGILIAFIASALMKLMLIIGQAVTFLVVIGRAIELYFYATFSPIPIVLLGFDETKQIGIGFIKNFVALCLSYVGVYFILGLWNTIWADVVFAGVLADFNGAAITVFLSPAALAAAAGAPVAGGIIAITLGVILVRVLGMTVILITALLGTGRWARSLLGS